MKLQRAGAPDAEAKLENFKELLAQSTREEQAQLSAQHERERPERIQQETASLQQQHFPDMAPPGVTPPAVEQTGPRIDPPVQEQGR